MSKTDLTEANLSYANICGCDLTNLILDKVIMKGTKYNRHTKFPDGFRIPEDAIFLEGECSDEEKLTQQNCYFEGKTMHISKKAIDISIKCDDFQYSEECIVGDCEYAEQCTNGYCIKAAQEIQKLIEELTNENS